MKRSLLLVLILGTLSLAACRADDPPAQLADSPGTAAFLARLEQALTREGYVYHVSAAASASLPGNPPEPIYGSELWIDTTHDNARFEFKSREGMTGDRQIRSVELAVGSDVYSGSPSDGITKLDARDQGLCPDAIPNPAFVWLICGPGLPRDATATVSTGVDYHGTRADALVLSIVLHPDPGDHGPTPPSGSPDPMKPLSYTFRFFVDANSYLPLGGESDAVQEGKNYGKSATQLSGEFVSATSLAAGFFDPAALGYVSPQDRQRAILDSFLADGPFFWLGRHFDPGSGLPALDFAEPFDTRGTGAERSSIGFSSYSGAGSLIHVENWSPSGWTSFWERVRGGTPWGSSCAKQTTLDLPAGRATVWLGYRRDGMAGPGGGLPVPMLVTPPAGSTLATPTAAPTATPPSGSLPGVFPTATPRTCTGEPFDVAIAWIEVSGRVVTINAPVGLGSIATQQSAPFDTLAGMEALLRGLRQMQPGE